MARDPMFPLGAPEVRDGAITIDMMLNEPTRIDNYAARLVERDLLWYDASELPGLVARG